MINDDADKKNISVISPTLECAVPTSIISDENHSLTYNNKSSTNKKEKFQFNNNSSFLYIS